MSGGSQAPLRVVLGVSGSVAAIKFTELMGELGALDASVEVKVVLTESARRFVSDAEIAEVKTCAWCSGVYTDDDEWSAWRKKGDPWPRGVGQVGRRAPRRSTQREHVGEIRQRLV